MWDDINLIGSLCSIVSLGAVVIAGVRRRRIQRQTQLIGSAPQKDRARLIEAVLGHPAPDTAKLSPTQQSKIALETLRQRSERFRWGLIASLVAFVLSLTATLMAYAFREPSLYQIQITVLGPDGQPIHGTELHSSVAGVTKQLANGWELEISAGKRPTDGLVLIWATKKYASLFGQSEVTLGDDFHPTVTLQLSKEETEVRGLVVDAERRPVAGVGVSVHGYGEEAVSTDADGHFVLPAHAADGEWVKLRAYKEGFQVFEELVLAGKISVTVELEALQ